MARNLTIIVVLLAAVLSGCAQSWQPAKNQLPYVWHGQPVELFFAKYGQPYQSHRAGKGRTLYRWRSRPNVRAIRMAQDAYLHADERPVHVCALEIETDKHDKIDEFDIIDDGIGLWGTSSCNEMFAGDPRHERTSLIQSIEFPLP